MRILVCGSRYYTDKAAIRNALTGFRAYYPDDPVVVVHGANGKRNKRTGLAYIGADLLADDVAAELGFEREAHPADWDKHGRAAGPIRTVQMYDTGIDVTLAFGHGRGTNFAVTEGRKRGVQVERYD